MALNLLRRFLRPNNYYTVCHRCKTKQTDVIVFDNFKRSEKKDRKTYLDMIKIYEQTETRRRGHVEFIYAAMRCMEEYGVNKDLEVYKKLLDVLPKGRFVPTNIFQAEYMHYPKQQQCAISLLDQMEDNAVMPDSEMQEMLVNIFGTRGYPLRKYMRMMYWMPKFKNLSPWRLPEQLPFDAFDLAFLAIQRITSVDNDTDISVFDTKDIEASLDKTWIISAQSPMQKTLLNNEYKEYEKCIKENEMDKIKALVVNGAFTVFLRDKQVSYFTLVGPVRHKQLKEIDYDDVTDLDLPNSFGVNENLPDTPPSVHEQDDGTIVAICATGSSSRDSLLSWIRLLEKNGNPGLSKLPVVFTLTAPNVEVAKIEETDESVPQESKSN